MKNGIICFLVIGTTATCWCPAKAQSEAGLLSDASASMLNPESKQRDIWQNGIGEGFRSTTQSIGVSSGATYGLAAFGGREAHHLALISLSYGHMLGHVCGEGHWYRGNWELRGEIFTGAQFSPDTEWLVGLTPHLRYHFATGTRWIPFVDGGAGVTATGIGPPDLSGVRIQPPGRSGNSVVHQGQRSSELGSPLCALVVCRPARS